MRDPAMSRSKSIIGKVPLPVFQYFTQIMKREKKNQSTLQLLLLISAMKNYQQTGALPTLAEAIEFAKSLEQPAKRERKHG